MLRTVGTVSLLALCAAAQTSPPSQTSKLPPGLYAVFNTSMGTITAELYEQLTPNTVRNFIGLAKGTRPWLDPKKKMLVMRPLYDNITFHRVIPDFMAQTGDPTGTGAHNCGFTIKDEIVPSLKFDRPGRLAMANTGTRDSGACQIFITEAPYPAGNGSYTIFGQVVDGQNVIPKITHVIRDSNDKPRFPVKLISVNIIRVVVAPESGPPTATAPGFYVNPAGDVLTSYHAVQGCTAIHLADGTKPTLSVFDAHNDVALLKSGKKVDTFAVFRDASEPLTAGGNVVIKATLAEGFLEAAKTDYSQSTDQPPPDPAKYTVEVQCWK